MTRIVGKILKVLLLVIGVLLVAPACLRAADIEGTLNVPKPARAIVYVDAVAGTFEAGKAILDQQNKVFMPYVLPVVKGTSVDFHNSDELQHNVFGVGADEFNLGNWTKGVVREHTFTKPGEVTLLCNVHPEMEAYVLVLQNPYFARPDGSGKFHIANVPPGNYVVKAWYQGKVRQQNVKVPATGSVMVSF